MPNEDYFVYMACRATGKSRILLSADCPVNAEKKAYKWINQHGFKRVVLKGKTEIAYPVAMQLYKKLTEFETKKEKTSSLNSTFV